MDVSAIRPSTTLESSRNCNAVQWPEPMSFGLLLLSAASFAVALPENAGETAKRTAAVGHIPDGMGSGHWTTSHILAAGKWMEVSDGRVTDNLVSFLYRWMTATVALYVTP